MTEQAARTELIHSAIIAIMRAVGPIAKNQRNTQQGYDFRGIDSVYNVCHPHFAEHGVYSTSEIVEAKHNTISANGKTINHAILKMRFTFRAEDGSSVVTEVVGEGMDYGGDKASNKAMSAADKYAILQLLKIPTAMIDSERTPHEQPAERPDAPKTQSRNARISDAQFAALRAKWKSRREGRGLPNETDNFRDWCFEKGLTAKKDALFSSAWTIALHDKAKSIIETEMPEDLT